MRPSSPSSSARTAALALLRLSALCAAISGGSGSAATATPFQSEVSSGRHKVQVDGEPAATPSTVIVLPPEFFVSKIGCESSLGAWLD